MKRPVDLDRKGRGLVVKLLAAVAVAAALAVPGASAKNRAVTSPGAHAHAGSACGSTVQKGPLPAWARAGFSATARVPHVLGRSGAIVAILFKYPLQAPPPTGQNDKILWVSRLPYTWRTTLRITAQRMKETQPVGAPVQTNIKGGPGPSLVNLTRPGCWRLALHWASHTDTLDLQYQPGR